MSQRRLVCLFEWLTAFPVTGPLPQQSQCLDIPALPPLKRAMTLTSIIFKETTWKLYHTKKFMNSMGTPSGVRQICSQK
jgi:hypothetical protein